MKTEWYKDSVIYQIYPRSFCDSNGDGIGDIQGIISKLDYLKELGVNCVWLSPCYKSPNDDNGYDISDYRDIMDEFGTLDDWKEMLKGMHERGIKLVMDLVANHSSDEHEWFKESRKSLDNPYRDYYFWRKGKGKNGKKPPNNWTNNFVGKAWEYDKATGEYYLHLFSKKQPDLNWDNPKVRQEIIDICNYWFELGVDGFRCDVIPYISKAAGLPNGKKLGLTGAEHYVFGENWDKYIREINEKSWSKYDSLIVGECALTHFEQVEHITDKDQHLLDTSFTFEHVTQDFVRKASLKKIKKVWRKYQNINPNCWTSNFFENHDQPRCIPRFAPSGEYRKKSACMLATSYFFLRGTPYIYQGQEIGMTNTKFEIDDYKDIMSVNILKAVKKYGLRPLAHRILLRMARDHARTPFQWNAEKNAGFTTGEPWMMVNPNYTEINFEADKNSDYSVFKYYSELIKARATVSNILADGKFTEYYPESNNILCYSRTLNGKTVLVIANWTTKPQKVKLDIAGLGTSKLLISNDKTLTDTLPNQLPPLAAVAYIIE